MKYSVCVAVVVATGVVSSASHAQSCTLSYPDFTEVVVAFEDKTVPLNADLATPPGLRSGRDDDAVSLVGPDGVSQAATFEDEPFLTRIVPAQPLTAGAWKAVVTGVNQQEARVDRSIAFTVADVIDTEPPAPPRVTYVREASACQPWPSTEFIGSIDSETDFDDVAMFDQLGLLSVYDAESVIFLGDTKYEDFATFDFIAVDFAGNRSEVGTAVEVGGCGCSTNDVPVLGGGGGVALGLLAWRRRRTTGR